MKTAVLNAYPQGAERITTIYEQAKVSVPSPDAVDEVIGAVQQHYDFRIRVRAMAVLPHIKERELAIDVLIEATKERDPEISGMGNVPHYAVYYLAQMKATRATSAVQDWCEYLKRESPYDDETRLLLITSAERRLAKLKAVASSESQNLEM